MTGLSAAASISAARRICPACPRGRWSVASNVHLVGVAELGVVAGYVLGDVHKYRSRASRGRNVEGFLDGAGQVLDIPDQVIVFRARPRHADNVRLLEGVITDDVGGHLTRKHDDGSGIHEGVRQTGDNVRAAGSGGDQYNPRTSCGAGIPLRHVHRPLFVAGENVAHSAAVKGIVDGQNGPSWVPEKWYRPLRPTNSR